MDKTIMGKKLREACSLNQIMTHTKDKNKLARVVKITTTGGE